MVGITGLKGRGQLETGLDTKQNKDRNKNAEIRHQEENIYGAKNLVLNRELSEAEATLPALGIGLLSKFLPSQPREESCSPWYCAQVLPSHSR